MNKKFLIGCLVFPIIVVIVFAIGFRLMGGKIKSTSTLKSGSWLVINPSGNLLDYNEIQYSDFMGLNQPSVSDICKAVKAAGEDSKITGILLKPRFIFLSHAGRAEIDSCLASFKSTGKPVIAYGDMFSQGDYLLCSMADRIYMEPSASAGIMLEGTKANFMFWKEGLDKLGIKIHVLQSGAYKGAGEMFSRTSLSQETYDNVYRVMEQRYGLITAELARHRNLEHSKVKAILEERPDYFISPKQALQYKLVDELKTIDKVYAEFDMDKKKFVQVSKYPAQFSVPGSDAIAVMNLSGDITPGSASGSMPVISAARVQSMIDQIKANKKIKAVVLRINSGGGSALESEHIYQKLKDLGTSVPIVASMGGVAASGGYYISCAAQHIVAAPYTITGSIGVVMMLPEAEGLSRKLGIRNQDISFGKYAGSMNFMNKTDETLLASLQRNSEAVYTEFKSRVADSRKLSLEEVELLAQGQVWSANDALDKKLIDQVGGLDLAIAKAAGLADIQDFQ
ncbi:MAG: signal peptide peptidase SppA, partial [Candidatus Cloacimonetes bacterium]|nr:signal peptide peptidase SppA [Candidatus Cloacimonadota bacterium]